MKLRAAGYVRLRAAGYVRLRAAGYVRLRAANYMRLIFSWFSAGFKWLSGKSV